jgi:hypothetical protein
MPSTTTRMAIEMPAISPDERATDQWREQSETTTKAKLTKKTKTSTAQNTN